MSITLTHSGRLKSAGMIEPLLQELSALAEEHGWIYELIGPIEHALLFGPVVLVRGIHLTLDPKAGLLARFTLSFDYDPNRINGPFTKRRKPPHGIKAVAGSSR